MLRGCSVGGLGACRPERVFELGQVAFGDVAVRCDDVPDLTHEEVALLKLGRRHPLFLAVHEAPYRTADDARGAVRSGIRLAKARRSLRYRTLA